ncbi:MAG: hypothetical protein AVO34_01685 [Firmicutes bacterium ML8_F2]|jgi:hypothetical protein|nr:MAG: hypothetical protein AVO34_01685 [Firmicutes bacterium ML8_F2]
MNIKKVALFFCFIIAIEIIPMARVAIAKDLVCGLGFYYGEQVNWRAKNLKIVPTDNYNMKHDVLHPYIGFAWDLAELGLEGTIGAFRFYKNGKSSSVFATGITLIGSYDFLEINERNRLYAGTGWGLSYWNRTPSIKLMNNKERPIITQLELGWKNKVVNNHLKYLKVSYRFTHTSALTDRDDRGVNLHGLYLGFFF